MFVKRILFQQNKISLPKKLGGLGIRTLRETNICLLGKLVWDMLQSSKKLWVDILSDRYVAGPKVLHATTHSSDSVTWSAILRARNILKDGFSWRVGSGSSSFWSWPLSSLGFIGSLAPYIDIHDLQLSIKDVISSGSPLLTSFTLSCPHFP